MSETDSSSPVLERQGARATIRLNRPKHLNRLQADDLDVLLKLFAEVEADPAAGLATGEDALITALSGALPHSPLGVTLEGSLAAFAEIPRAWPSAAKECTNPPGTAGAGMNRPSSK